MDDITLELPKGVTSDRNLFFLLVHGLNGDRTHLTPMKGAIERVFGERAKGALESAFYGHLTVILIVYSPL